VFLLSLVVSGVSSSTVGTMAGQMIMQGLVGFKIPIWVRRVVTMAPAFVVVVLGANATNALVISQVVLSVALPVPMLALLIFTGRADIMGAFKERPAHPRRGRDRDRRCPRAQRRLCGADIGYHDTGLGRRALTGRVGARCSDHGLASNGASDALRRDEFRRELRHIAAR